MSTVELTTVSRWYGNVVAVNDVTMTLGAGRDRAARPERRRQDDGAAHDGRLPAAVAGHGHRRRRADLAEPGRSIASSGSSSSARPCTAS